MDIRNLIFEGGGAKGAAYVGALQALEERGIMKGIRRVGGTSAGAINAVLLALQFSMDETIDIVFHLDFNRLMDDDFGMIRDVHRLLSCFGWHRGDFFREWMGEIIGKKAATPNATFADFKERGFLDLYLIGGNLSTGFSEVFSFEGTPGMPVLDAVRISMSIPLFFEAVRLEGSIYVDGGLFNNYPIRLFDQKRYQDGAAPDDRTPEWNPETLGFRLDTGDEISTFRGGAPKHRTINGITDYICALASAIMNVQDSTHLRSEDWHRTVYIDTMGFGALDFGLTDEDKYSLAEQGRAGVEAHFAVNSN